MTYTEEEKKLIVSGCKAKDGRLKIEDAEKLIKTFPRGAYNNVQDCKTLDELEKRGIVCVTYQSCDYPETLKNIDDPPAVLYCKGNINLLKSNCFSVVGSRKSTASAIALCKQICGELTAAFTVVTGMAEGVDSAAIEGALPSGKIISVLTNGFDYIYPKCNANLLQEVIKRGLVISEYPPHIRPQKFNFPLRNRIIAGLSRGTLVASAGEKSGALITANYALEYGREVFAFPYNVGVTSGKGCNRLIKNGAYLTENILDIFREFGLDLKKSEKPALTAEEKAVYEEIAIAGEAFLPVVAQNLKMFTYQLLPVITALEMKGLIIRLGGNRYGII